MTRISGRINNVPLKKHQRSESLRDYSVVCVQLLALLLRKKKTYRLPLPTKISASVDRLQMQLQEDDLPSIVIACNDTLYRIWSRVWEKTKENSLGDPTICLIALAMLKPDGSFAPPERVTPYIAKLEYCMRLIFLVAIHLASHDDKSKLNKHCDTYQPWFIEKVESTFNSIRSLQHRATALVMSATSMPRVVWTDRTTYCSMRYHGHTVEFNKLQCVFQNMEQDVIQLWEKEILLGLPLHVTYTSLSDDLANTNVGYSFLSDVCNPMFQDRDRLAREILAHPVLSKTFLTGLTDKEGKPIWNVVALQKWLFSYSRFEGIQLANVEMKAGSPGRGTELCCLEYRNTRTRSQRGLYVMGNHLAVVCQYHKSGSITGNDKVIPHALDAVTSDLVIQDLAIARPFAELAAFLCYPQDKDIQGRYNSYLFVNNRELFTSTQLTTIMRSYTLPVFDFGMGVNDWRHISAAFRRKLCPGLDDLIEEDTHDTVSALQSGHTRRTENRIYGISPDALAGPAEDVLPLFLDASTDWQVACKMVPGGHLLPYHQARMQHFQQLAASKMIKANYATQVETMEQHLASLDARFDQRIEQMSSRLESKFEEMMGAWLNRTVSKMGGKISIYPCWRNIK